MEQLLQDYQKYMESNAEVIVIGPESPEEFAKWWHEHKMPFVGIPDPNHSIAKLYNQEIRAFYGGRLPAMVIIDKDFKIRVSYVSGSPSDIPSDDEVLNLIAKLNQEVASSLTNEFE
jgi:peroxiredoxin Q/BCP